MYMQVKFLKGRKNKLKKQEKKTFSSLLPGDLSFSNFMLNTGGHIPTKMII